MQIEFAIIGSLSLKEFGIEAKVPDNFDGIPVLNNLKSNILWLQG